MILRSVLILPVVLLQAQTGDSVAELVAKARQVFQEPGADRTKGDQLLAQALYRCRPFQPADASGCAQAAVLSGLVALGQQLSLETMRSDLESTLRFYEGSNDLAGTALSLELLALAHSAAGNSAESQTARQRASVLRTRHIEELVSRDAGASYTGTPVNIGTGITAPRPERKPEPQYSDDARVARYQGSVLVAIVIDTDGSVRNIKLVRSLGFGLDEAAYEAVRTWHFQPSLKDGEPVAVTANVELNFRLL